MKTVLYIVVLLLSVAPLACNSAKPKAKANPPKPASTPLPSPPPSSEGGDDSDGEKDDCEEGGVRLALLATVDYENDLKPILDRACTGACHPGGGTTKDLTTYAGAKSYAAAMVASVDNDSMPPSGGMSASDKQAFRDWVDSGMPERATQDQSGGGNGSSGSNSGSGSKGDDFFGNCKDSVPDDEVFEGVAECKEDGKIYDYKRESCIADIGDYDCDKEGIIKAFKDERVLVESKIDEYEDDGYEIDQCGETAEGPIVIFVRKYQSTDVTVEAKNLCMPGSQFCR